MGEFLKIKILNLVLINIGYRPEPDKSKISYNEKIYPLPEIKRDAELQKEQIDALKRWSESGRWLDHLVIINGLDIVSKNQHIC